MEASVSVLISVLQVLAPLYQPQETDRGEVQPSLSQHDHAAPPQALQTTGGHQDSWSELEAEGQYYIKS